MKLILFTLACLALCSIPSVLAADWAVIVAGSNTFDNYRHQADACHAYQIVAKNGIPSDHIITMMYDDIANDPANPFPGQIFNKPTDKGVAGVDVYANIQKDYTGADVTPEMFLAILTGNSQYPGAKKVIKSSSEDRIFIFFVDHGGPGLIAFPSEYLYATDLIKALNTMYTQKMYSRMVFYVEACESGSMFSGLLPSTWNIYVTTASNPDESSWGTYCPPEDSVNGVEINSCLGDLYSVNWMENTDEVGMKQTLQEQFKIVQNLTAQSHVMQYGDLSFTSDTIGDYLSESKIKRKHSHRKLPVGDSVKPIDASKKPSSYVSSRDIPLHLAYYRYLRAGVLTPEAKLAREQLRAQLDAREEAEERFTQLAYHLSVDEKTGKMLHTPEHLFNPPTLPIHSGSCVKSAVSALKANGCDYDDFSLQFHAVIVNACRRHQHEENGAKALVAAIKKVCKKE